jgi:hypothetical protein
VKKKRTKKYSPGKFSKIAGVGAEFGGTSDDTDENGDMLTRGSNKSLTIKDLRAINYKRRWCLTVCVFLKSEFGGQYQDQFTKVTDEECDLEALTITYVPDIALKLLAGINDNHYDYWGWHAEAL